MHAAHDARARAEAEHERQAIAAQDARARAAVALELRKIWSLHSAGAGKLSVNAQIGVCAADVAGGSVIKSAPRPDFVETAYVAEVSERAVGMCGRVSRCISGGRRGWGRRRWRCMWRIGWACR